MNFPVDSSSDQQVTALRRRALDAAARGRTDDAADLWRQVLSLSPNQPDGLHFLGLQAIQRGDSRTAFALLEQASLGAADNAMIHINFSLAARALGDRAAEMLALDRALAADPNCFPALLAKSELLERSGERRQAALIARDAVAITPPDARLSPSLAQMAANARRRVSENAAALAAFLRERMGPVESDSPRMAECLSIASGLQKAYVQQPTLLHFPRLPAISFYDNDDFPWIAGLEAATGDIAEELADLLVEDEADFTPYVARYAGVPLSQWAELNHSLKWSAYFLWKDGKPIEDHQRRCPRTVAALEAIPMAGVPDTAPSAFFSALLPRSHIPPHTGVTNTRLIVHLPLIVPEDCQFRVGNQKRTTERGRAWVFDDSIEHEAWNDSDKPRIILIFDIWNPLLSPAEREAVAALVSGMADYYRQA